MRFTRSPNHRVPFPTLPLRNTRYSALEITFNSPYRLSQQNYPTRGVSSVTLSGRFPARAQSKPLVPRENRGLITRANIHPTRIGPLIGGITKIYVVNMPPKAGIRQATLGYVKDPQSSLWCVLVGAACVGFVLMPGQHTSGEPKLIRRFNCIVGSSSVRMLGQPKPQKSSLRSHFSPKMMTR